MVSITLDKINAEADYMELVISWNVKMLLAAKGESQTALGEILGLQRSSISNKLKGRAAWSVADLIKTALFLNTTPEALMDDKLMRQMGIYPDVKNEKTLTHEVSGSSVLGAGLEPARL